MQPTPNVVFVKEVPFEIKKNNFEYVEDKKTDYVVTAVGNGVSVCKVGDNIIFFDSKDFEYKGQKIKAIEEQDIKGVGNA